MQQYKLYFSDDTIEIVHAHCLKEAAWVGTSKALSRKIRLVGVVLVEPRS